MSSQSSLWTLFHSGTLSAVSFLCRTCLELAEICREVGLPPGVLNVVTGLGSEAGASLASHPQVDKVSFPNQNSATGSVLYVCYYVECNLFV